MKTAFGCLPLLCFAWLIAPAAAQDDAPLKENLCATCHGDADIWDADMQHLFVTPADLANDIHWQKGILCQDCHGGNADTLNLREAHSIEDGFRVIESPADIPAFCGHCHSNAETMKQANPQASTDVVQRFLDSVHGQHLQQSATAGAAGTTEAATCISCHGKHQTRAVGDPQSLAHPARLAETCGSCHQPQRDALLADVHHQPGPPDGEGPGTVLGCNQCHGADMHSMVPVAERQSPVSGHNQLESCGRCHEKEMQSYLNSRHGRGLLASGLLVTAVCSDCHGSHGILPRKDPQSTLHAANVDATCAQCHRFIADWVEASVHGRHLQQGDAPRTTAAGREIEGTLNCIDCHEPHVPPHPKLPRHQQPLTHHCRDCHSEQLHQHAVSVHSVLTPWGYRPAATCADCHGGHHIAQVSDPASPVALVNRAETCGKCHPGASGNFLDFDPHANHADRQRNAGLYAVYAVLLTCIVAGFGAFGLHAVFWLVRGTVDAVRNGRPKRWTPGAVGYVRLPGFHRLAQAALLVSLLALALTGLPLKYSHAGWAQTTAHLLGGFASTSVWHRMFGLLSLGWLIVCAVWMLSRPIIARRRGVPVNTNLFGPDSLLPARRDGRDLAAVLRWFAGRGERPAFERWTYWEKLVFWGALATILLLGFTGLMLWFPQTFSIVLPGQALNVAKVIHAQGLLLAGLVLAVYFFAVHFRPEKFPLDMSMVTGVVSEQELREERPDWLQRLEREGKLDSLRTTVPSRRQLWTLAAGRALALMIALALVAGLVAGALGG
ncbi:MAG: hypothetical protein KJ000_08825 [Pirellulaceae bacterium]|nr:hypothetical protein [Pirellulaceae bacterium]